jgi:hypothetical protein
VPRWMTRVGARMVGRTYRASMSRPSRAAKATSDGLNFNPNGRLKPPAKFLVSDLAGKCRPDLLFDVGTHVEPGCRGGWRAAQG